MRKYYKPVKDGKVEISADEYYARKWQGMPVISNQPDPIVNHIHPLKYDEGKYDPTLVEPWVVKALAAVYQEGIDKKYSRNSWKKFEIEKARELIAPAIRHIDAYREGEMIDPDGGNPHLLKAAWNLLTVYYHEEKERGR